MKQHHRGSGPCHCIARLSPALLRKAGWGQNGLELDEGARLGLQCFALVERNETKGGEVRSSVCCTVLQHGVHGMSRTEEKDRIRKR